MRKLSTGLLVLLIIMTTGILSPVSAAAAEKSLIISYDHRKNMGNTKKLSIDALSSATVYSGPTGEKKSTEQVIRDTIKSETKSKVFEIRVKKAYSTDYEKTVQRADEEIDRNKNIKFKTGKIPGLKKYKKIYLVTPIWHGDLPQPVRVLLRNNDFSGKTIVLFGVNLGSGFGSMVRSIREECPGAAVVKARAFYGDAKNNAVKKKVRNWIRKNRK